MLPYRAFFVRARPSAGLHPRSRSGSGKIEGWYRTGVAARKYTGHTGKYAGKNHVIPAVMGTFHFRVFADWIAAVRRHFGFRIHIGGLAVIADPDTGMCFIHGVKRCLIPTIKKRIPVPFSGVCSGLWALIAKA